MKFPKDDLGGRMIARCIFAAVTVLASAIAARPQDERPSVEEIPLERCDRLPMVRVRIGPAELRFLVDTGATSMLNLKSVRALKQELTKSQAKEIEVTSWSGTAATSAREVSISEFALGSHRLQGLRLPAIDLSPIGIACGGAVDGILGVDLLDRMEVTIDLKRQIASFNGLGAGYSGSKSGEGTESATNDSYLQQRYFRFVPELKYHMNLHDVRMFGNALWYSYEYSIDTPGDHLTGHGFAMCHRNGERWQMLNMHNSMAQNVATGRP